VRVGIAHHLGWAVAVTASAGHVVVDRRRIGLIEPGTSAAPVEHEPWTTGWRSPPRSSPAGHSG
jgi:hypothetical protein